MTLTKQLTRYMQRLETIGTKISDVPNTEIVENYYYSIGVHHTTPFSKLMYKMVSKEIPAYESVTRAIRKARALTPRWRKAKTTKAREIIAVKDEVGY